MMGDVGQQATALAAVHDFPRHRDRQVFKHPDDGTVLFATHATFCAQPPAVCGAGDIWTNAPPSV
jgi:alpha-L-arabinofuranosidase B-like protein